MPDLRLGDKVRSKLLSGALPRGEPVKTWAGYGRGEPCMACDAPILPAQVAYEMDMADGSKVPMHMGCHGLWVAERTRHGWGPAPHRHA
jgi:hypothetical protein